MICRNHVDVAVGVRRCARCGSPFCNDCLVDIAERPYCATCKTEQLLDARSGVDYTVLDIANIGRRIVAYIIDSVLLYIVNQVITVGLTLAAVNTSASPGLMFMGILVSLTTNILYDGILTAARGQTLGKMAMKIRVVSENGAAVSTGQAWGRAAAKLIPFAAFVALFNDEHKGLHDMLAHTRVVNAN
jgi:uncharacterized RDD family membrane protein YckC